MAAPITSASVGSKPIVWPTLMKMAISMIGRAMSPRAKNRAKVWVSFFLPLRQNVFSPQRELVLG